MLPVRGHNRVAVGSTRKHDNGWSRAGTCWRGWKAASMDETSRLRIHSLLRCASNFQRHDDIPRSNIMSSYRIWASGKLAGRKGRKEWRVEEGNLEMCSHHEAGSDGVGNLGSACHAANQPRPIAVPHLGFAVFLRNQVLLEGLLSWNLSDCCLVIRDCFHRSSRSHSILGKSPATWSYFELLSNFTY